MSDHVFLVLTNPSEGLEDEYNDWYTNFHLDEVVAVPGFASARRYELSDSQLGDFGKSKHAYLAIYEIEGDPADAFAALHDELDSGRMKLPEALGRDDINPWCYTPISETVRAKDASTDATGDYVFLVLTNPTEGLEDEYNDWYTNFHLEEVVAVDGFLSARRYRLSDAQLDGFGRSKHTYLAIYELEGDPAAALAALNEALGSRRMKLPEALGRDDINPWCYTPISATVRTQRQAGEVAAAR